LGNKTIILGDNDIDELLERKQQKTGWRKYVPFIGSGKEKEKGKTIEATGDNPELFIVTKEFNRKKPFVINDDNLHRVQFTTCCRPIPGDDILGFIDNKNHIEIHRRDCKVADKLKAERDDARDEIAALEKQNDELYELANTQQVVEREVVRTVAPEDYEELKRRAKTLEGSNKLYHEDYQKLRKKNEELRRELDKAKVLIGEKQRNDSAEWDIATLTTATNNYLRQYGGKAWAFDQFYRVDETTQAEFVKAINNLAAFAQNLAQLIQEKKQLGA
jgi:hypothetical protein